MNDQTCEIRLNRACMCPENECLYPYNVGPEPQPQPRDYMIAMLKIQALEDEVTALKELVKNQRKTNVSLAKKLERCENKHT